MRQYLAGQQRVTRLRVGSAEDGNAVKNLVKRVELMFPMHYTMIYYEHTLEFRKEDDKRKIR